MKNIHLGEKGVVVVMNAPTLGHQSNCGRPAFRKALTETGEGNTSQRQVRGTPHRDR